MGFLIYMLVMDLLIPLTMICLGKYFMKSAPKKINMIFGYRSFMSMKNQDTWIFAHNYCGKIWYVTGMISLMITVIAMLSIMGRTENTIGTVGGVICAIQMIPLIGSIIPTEMALKKTFDKNGNRR